MDPCTPEAWEAAARARAGNKKEEELAATNLAESVRRFNHYPVLEQQLQQIEEQHRKTEALRWELLGYCGNLYEQLQTAMEEKMAAQQALQAAKEEVASLRMFQGSKVDPELDHLGKQPL